MPAKKKEKPEFEESLERLEKIVDEMESGDLSLEKMMSHFEEGMRLIKLCSTRLNNVEQKIELLVKQGDQLVAGEFDRDDDPGPTDDDMEEDS